MSSYDTKQILSLWNNYNCNSETALILNLLLTLYHRENFSILVQGFFSGFSTFPPSTKTNAPIRSENEGHRFVSFAVSVTLTK